MPVFGIRRLPSLALAWGLLALGTAAPAADAPAKKDSPALLQPKEVTWTTSISPATAKPGDVVTYSVSATVKAPWHIYAFDKVQPQQGPRSTQFDLFDSGGLTPSGDWKPDRQPLKKKEPAFPNLAFVSFYETKVTWSLELKVPADAKPGKVTVRNQAYFQICDPKACKPPSRVTVPPTTVTIGGGSASLPSLSTLLVAFQAPQAVTRRPQREDSNPVVVPKEVSWSTSVRPAVARPGDQVSYTVTASIKSPWHIYAYAKADFPKGIGPQVTKFEVFEMGGLRPSGEWSADSDPKKKFEPGFKKLPHVSYHEGKVTWTLPIQVPADVRPGKVRIANQATFMICNDNGCKGPGRLTLPDATLTVEGLSQSSPLLAPLLIGFVPPPESDSTSSKAAEVSKTAAPAKAAAGTVQASIDQGLLPFLLFSAAGGLVAILMPCVWPMIPITVNFFVKQGQANKGRATKLAFAYCLAIIGIFTSMGLAVTFARGASGASDLGNNPWLNLVMGIAFIALGLSLLGLFEIRLPMALLNKSAEGEGKGGIVGVMFMALTLTITSFTCTAPVVGGLLGLATKGQVFYPVLGMLTFSAVLALPFFVVALVPSVMSKLPRSGDWMNAVKVVGALVEIGAAFKFLNTAETNFGTTPANAWIDATVILTVWVVMALVAGIYLLGLFRTDHDHDAVKVGPLRMMFGIVFLGAALYLAPALFGNPPNSRFYGQIVGLLPNDQNKFDLASKTAERIAASLSNSSSPANAEGNGPKLALPKKATSTDPQQAIREEKRFHGVLWGMSYEDALAEAKSTGKLVLIDFTGVNCANCRTVETSIMPQPEVAKELQNFIPVQLYTDQVDIDSLTPDQREELATANLLRETEMTGEQTSPLYVVVSPEGKVLSRTGYDADHGFLLRFLKEAQAKHGDGQKIAKAD